MNTATHTYDLRVVDATPWTPSAPALSRALAGTSWRRMASSACAFAGLLAFGICMITLRLSLYPQAIVSSRAAVIMTLAVGVAGVAAFFAAHHLHETP
jgi:hypothetical protein